MYETAWFLFYGILMGFAMGTFVYHFVGKIYDKDKYMRVTPEEMVALRAVRRAKRIEKPKPKVRAWQDLCEIEQ